MRSGRFRTERLIASRASHRLRSSSLSSCFRFSAYDFQNQNGYQATEQFFIGFLIIHELNRTGNTRCKQIEEKLISFFRMRMRSNRNIRFPNERTNSARRAAASESLQDSESFSLNTAENGPVKLAPYSYPTSGKPRATACLSCS